MPTPRPALLSVALLASACAHASGPGTGPGTGRGDPAQNDDPQAVALASIRAEDIAAHVAVLASDAYEGRFPGSAGEAKTVSYLAASFARLGLQPASAAGYLQPVPLVAQRVDPSSALVITTATGERRLGHGEGIVFSGPGEAATVEVASEGLVFAGYGIVAPEQGWDDYAGVDVGGKTVVVLAGDPGPTRADPSFFKGLALTHHGTTKAKLERARERGAAALLVLHDEQATGLPWAVVAQGSRQTKMQLRGDAGRAKAPTLVGALPIAGGRELLAELGLDLDAAREAAARDGFRATSLALSHRYVLSRSSEPIDSHNVVAWIPGAAKPDEFVLYSAHWDHVGVGPEGTGKDGDRIYNGAVDNATGTAALLELAEAFAAAPTPPRRSVVFLATTAEEQGLLGSSYYTEDPLFPLADTVAVINMDALFPFGASKGMTLVAPGSSDIEEQLAVAAQAVGRTIVPDPAPQMGAFFRSDHYPFAAKGVPAIFAVGGPNPDPAAGETLDIARFVDYLQHHYHQVSDEYDPGRWDMAGIVQDVEVYFRTGWAIANAQRRPSWYPDSEFAPLR